MTSIVSAYKARDQGLARFVKPESPAYNVTGDSENSLVVLFPFSYSNGVLDISYSGNTFKSVMVDDTGNSPSSETDTAVQILGKPQLVTSLGDNFKAYIRAWRTGIDSGSPIEIYINPLVIRVQEVDLENISANSGESYRISTQPPASDTYPAGTDTNNYQAKYVFKSPLTFTTIEGGVKQYITFRTAFDQE
jgi:hypothetical protein